MGTRRQPDSERTFLRGSDYARRDYGYAIGQAVGRWTVIGAPFIKTRADGRGSQYYRCRCGCGTESDVLARNLASGASNGCKLCACKRASVQANAHRSYAHICPERDLRLRLLSRIHSCLQRCHKETHPSYKNYGARGIAVHAEWRVNRAEFLRYLLTLPGHDNPSLDLDRRENHLGYVPGNLRFITKSENNKNKRSASELSARIHELEKENEDLKARLRHFECGAPQAIHGAN